MPENTRSQDYRVVFSNIFHVQLTPTEIQTIWGIQKNPGTEDLSMEAQVGVVTTHSGAKLLAYLLNALIADFEDATKTTVQLDPARVQHIDDLMAANRAARAGQKF